MKFKNLFYLICFLCFLSPHFSSETSCFGDSFLTRIGSSIILRLGKTLFDLTIENEWEENYEIKFFIVQNKSNENIAAINKESFEFTEKTVIIIRNKADEQLRKDAKDRKKIYGSKFHFYHNIHASGVQFKGNPSSVFVEMFPFVADSLQQYKDKQLYKLAYEFYRINVIYSCIQEIHYIHDQNNVLSNITLSSFSIGGTNLSEAVLKDKPITESTPDKFSNDNIYEISNLQPSKKKDIYMLAIALLDYFTDPYEINVYEIIKETDDIVESFFNKVKASLNVKEEAVVDLLLNKVIFEMPENWPTSEYLLEEMLLIDKNEQLMKKINERPTLRNINPNETFHHYVALKMALTGKTKAIS